MNIGFKAGDILWLKGWHEFDDKLLGGDYKNSHAGRFGHPVVALTTTARFDPVTVCVMTSFGNTPFRVKFYTRKWLRSLYLPVYPSLPHPDNGILLFSEGNTRPLKSVNYVDIREKIVLESSMVRKNGYGNLTGASLATLLTKTHNSKMLDFRPIAPTPYVSAPKIISPYEEFQSWSNTLPASPANQNNMGTQHGYEARQATENEHSWAYRCVACCMWLLWWALLIGVVVYLCDSPNSHTSEITNFSWVKNALIVVIKTIGIIVLLVQMLLKHLFGQSSGGS